MLHMICVKMTQLNAYWEENNTFNIHGKIKAIKTICV